MNSSNGHNSNGASAGQQASISRREFAQRAGIAAGSLLLAPTLVGQPSNPVPNPRLLRNTQAAVFERCRELVAERKPLWQKTAETIVPRIRRSRRDPVNVITVTKDAASFQGWKAVTAGPVESACNRPLLPGDSFILDFGEHFTGYFTLSVCQFKVPVDAPIRLSLVFGEVLSEVAEPLDSYKGDLSRSWMQDEIINIDLCPSTFRLQRRYAFRYVKISVVAASRFGTFGFTGFTAEAVTSADETRMVPFTPRNDSDAALDRIAVRTLRDCMQTVFEDGPKRDRRLWLGDLRLQAQANYVTYRNYDLVKRCLYILSATADDNGLVSTCAFEHPTPVRGGDSILDYTALFAPTVLDYFKATSDAVTAKDLWPLVLNQLDFTLKHINDEGLFIPPSNWWQFVDWHSTLDKQASEHAIILYGVRATQQLGGALGRQKDVRFLNDFASRMVSAAQKFLWDDARGVFVSGPNRQVSWASQAWMALAGVAEPDQGKKALLNALKDPAAVKPGSPYLYHHVVEALQTVGLPDEASNLLNSYWGGMVKKGADTFWEVYVPENDLESPYKSHLINSYCHAWSCTPTYFLRKSST